MSSKRTLLEKWYKDVWQDGNLDAIDTYFSAGAAAEGIVSGLSVDPEDLRELVSMVRPLVNDLQVGVLHCIEDDDWLSAIVEVRGTASRNADPVHAFSQVMIRVEDNKICEAYYAFDALSFFEQLGQLPPNTMPQLLSGTFMS